MITYAIGDVHGRADLLHALLAAMRSDAANAGSAYKVIFLGDIIDRGSNSRMALDLVIRTLAEVSGSRLILGNHEEFMLRYIFDPFDRELTRDRWLANGGFETLVSYGLRGNEADEVIIERLKGHDEHLDALLAADSLVEDNTCIYVHAGLRPGVPLENQVPEDLRWIRREFLDSTVDFGKIVVHGHTPTKSRQPEIYPNRIGIDTMAFASDRLTAARFPQGETLVSFLCTERRGDDITVTETIGLHVDRQSS